MCSMHFQRCIVQIKRMHLATQPNSWCHWACTTAGDQTSRRYCSIEMIHRLLASDRKSSRQPKLQQERRRRCRRLRRRRDMHHASSSSTIVTLLVQPSRYLLLQGVFKLSLKLASDESGYNTRMRGRWESLNLVRRGDAGPLCNNRVKVGRCTGSCDMARASQPRRRK